METTRTTEFKQIVSNDFKRWCSSRDIQPSQDSFIEFLIEKNLINDTTIKRFVIISAYPEALDENMGIKYAAIWQLEEKYNVPESTIRVYIKRFQNFFKAKPI
jgi:hypothetical protein